MAEVSVIVPVYNIEQYLPRCLDSILSQTHRNLEILVVDDGSTDNSSYVIRQYAKKDKRIIPLFKKNTGVSDTRNKALDKATGDYIGFVDGDDYIEPDMFEILLDNALRYQADIRGHRQDKNAVRHKNQRGLSVQCRSFQKVQEIHL